MSPHNLKLVVSYDGTRYLGWQKTVEGASIEETLQQVLERIAQHPIALQAASRTDAGVHALGQVVNCFWKREPLDLRQLLLSVNQLLPSDLSVLSIEEMEESFHPTLDARGKEYLYRLDLSPFSNPLIRLYAWHVHHLLDFEKMEKGAHFLVGTHDFSAFCNERDKDPICTIEAISIRGGEIHLRGNRFLYRMARNLVGTLVATGQGKILPEEIPQILDSKDRKRAGVTAPAHGLTLSEVFFQNK